MEARDFRSIGRPAQEELRRRALVLIAQGASQTEAARAVGVQRQTVNLWLKRYRAQGEDSVLDGRRVSSRRGKRLLTTEEAQKVQRWIADQMPDQLKRPFALWTARAVLELIADRFDKRLGLSTVQLYLKRWGLSPQKPLARGRERSPSAIKAWLERDYPLIARKAKTERAAIYWGDETGISNQDQIGRTWAPKGRTPVVARTAKRPQAGLPPDRLLEPTQSLISAVSNLGLRRFMVYEGALNADRFIGFLRRLIKDAKQKVVLIVDNLKVHHAKRVKAWLASHAHEIELFYLPAYAPDQNPDEYLNNDLKQRLRQQPQPSSRDDLIKTTRGVLRNIQRSPTRVQGYFRPAPFQYAA